MFKAHDFVADRSSTISSRLGKSSMDVMICLQWSLTVVGKFSKIYFKWLREIYSLNMGRALVNAIKPQTKEEQSLYQMRKK